jgi:tubulin-folding cofactor B
MSNASGVQLASSELEGLKAYVTGEECTNRSSSTVLLRVTHSNLSQVFNELRFDTGMNVQQVKEKLRSHTGTSVASMQLLLLAPDGSSLLAGLSDDSKPLAFFNPSDGCTLHIVDTDPHSASVNGWLEDTSKVQKYRMSEEAYNRRENTFRKWCQKKREEDPSWTLEKEMARRRGEPEPESKHPLGPEYQCEEASSIYAGMRCEVSPGAKRGSVRLVSNNLAGLAPGYWVGIEYDEPVGKGDGSAKGHRHFTCSNGFGAFVRPAKVAVGTEEEFLPAFEEDSDLDEI